MTKALGAAALGTFLLLTGPPAGACGETLRGPTRTLDGASYVVVFITSPDPVAVGSHFALDFAVCPKASAEAPRTVRVDANMPEHRHGMNYKPVVVARSGGIFRADGFMFHMPGRWDLVFDVGTGGGSERLTGILQLE